MMELKGLSENEVADRKKTGRVNASQKKVSKSALRIVFDNWFSLFNFFNAAIAVALALVGAWLNMAFVLIIVLNASIGTVQELRAKRLVEKLSVVTAPVATAVRGGKEVEIPVAEIVLDDILQLCAGDQIPADAIVLSGLAEVNEAALTGESLAVQKTEGAELLSGSYITGGKCAARVIRVGADSFAAKITREAKRHKKPSSELLRSMAKVTYITSFALIPLGALLFCVSYFGPPALPLKDAVTSTAAALLGMLPKGLVLISTIALFTGVIKLSKKNAYVQDLHSIETLARVNVLCLDKTGTLTTGVMRLCDVIFTNKTLPAEKLLGYFASATEDGNATIGAVKAYFKQTDAPRVTARVPFSSDKKWSGLTFEGTGTVLLGAPEVFAATLPENAEQARKAGKRVLCAAFSPDALTGAVPQNAVVFAALILDDPVRENAKETLEYFTREGVALKIISGDNPLTASLVAREAGLAGYENYVDMSGVSPEKVAEAAQKYTVFGRVSPEQKKALVAALKAAGNVVAMTGDGVNDLPALREADCGIALSSGTAASKQAADLVLAENGFTALPEIVVEGRRVMNNVTRVGGVFFIKTIYSVLLCVFCIAARVSFPFIPIQITLLDAAIEAYPSFFLSFEPDKNRITNRFLPSVLKHALPYALFVTFACLAVSLIANIANLSQSEAATAAYYLTGFFSVYALFRSAAPLNKFRMFLCVTSCLGFFGAAILFGSYLSLAPLSVPILLLFLPFAAAGVILIPLLGKLTDKFFK